MSQEELFALLAKSLLYTPIVYKQSTYTTNQNNFDNVFVLEFKHTELPDDSLLFFVPSVSSNDSGTCTLRIRVPYLPTGSSSYSYEDRNFTIVKVFLCIPTLFCLKKIGPLESIFIAINKTIQRGIKTIIAIPESIISISRLKKCLYILPHITSSTL